MIAVAGYSTKLYYATGDGGTTANTYSSSDLSGGYEIDNSQLIEVMVVSEQEADDQEEPNTEREASVTWERPNRRLATINRAGRKTYPRRRSPWLGTPGRQWSRHKAA